MKVKDDNGALIGTWCTKSSTDDKAVCKLCNKEISVKQNGIKALKSHSKSNAHQRSIEATSGSSSLKDFFKFEKRPESISARTADAEIIWCLHVVENNYSFLSNNHVRETFSTMFNDKTAANMKLKEAKIAYLVKDAIFPYFKKELVHTLKSSTFSVQIDEANKLRNHLGIVVRYFTDDTSWDVKTQCFDIPALEKGDAEHIAQAITEAFRDFEVPLQNLVCAMSDSCNTMRGKKSGVIVRLQAELPHLIDIGGCSLHHVHNSVRNSISEIDLIDLEQTLSDIFNFFRYNSYDSDYKISASLADVEKHKFIRLVDTRWLQCLPVIERVLEQLDALKHFFESMVRQPNTSCACERMHRIQKALENPLTECFLRFLATVLKPLGDFEKLFQKDGCIIHDLWQSMTRLLIKWLLMYKEEKNIDVKEPWKCANPEFMLADHKIIIGERTSALLPILNSQQKNLFFVQVRKFYVKCTEQLVHYLPFENRMLRHLRFLDPKNMKSPNLEIWIMNIAKKMAHEFPQDQLSQLRCEVRSVGLQSKETDGEEVTCFWKRITTEFNVPLLRKLVRRCLVVPHGNADVERLFSKLTDIITKKRSSLDQQSIQALAFISSHMTAMQMTCYQVPITAELRDMAANAKAMYKRRLQQKKMNEEEEGRERLREKMEETMQRNQKLKKIENDLMEIDEIQKEAAKRKKKAEEMEEEARRMRETAAADEESQLCKKRKLLEKQQREERRITNQLLLGTKKKQ